MAEKVEEEDMNLDIELQAATTEGYSMHIGTMKDLLLILIYGITAKGSERTPITFSIIESASLILSPPFKSIFASILFYPTF